MTATLIRVSTRRTGSRETVRVWVYDTLEELRAAAQRFAPDDDFTDTLGVCQTYRTERLTDGEWHKVREPLIVRLWRERLGTRIVTHEMSHAACELYGRTLPDDALAAEHLDNANEILAHLHSDLTVALVDRLYALGFYDQP